MGMTWNFTDNSDVGEITLNEKAVESFKADLLKTLMLELKDQVTQAVIPSLGPKNFEGEAIEYLRLSALPLTDLEIEKHSKAIFLEFTKNVDDLIVYDKDTNTLIVSPFIEACEFGDYYRPLLKLITKSIESAFSEIIVN